MSAKPNDEMRARLEWSEGIMRENIDACKRTNLGGFSPVAAEAPVIDELDRLRAMTVELQAENKALRERLEPRGVHPLWPNVREWLEGATTSGPGAIGISAAVVLAELERRQAVIARMRGLLERARSYAAMTKLADDIAAELGRAG